MTELLKSYAGVSAAIAVLTLLLYLVSPLLGKRYRARSIYTMWIIVLLGFLIPARIPNVIPTVTATAPTAFSRPIAATFTQEPPVAAEDTMGAQAEVGGTAKAGAGAQPGAVRSAANGASPTWIDLITAAWLAGAAAALAFHILRHVLFLRSIRRWSYAVTNETALRVLKAEASRMGIRKTIRLFHCPNIGSPMIVGLLRSTLLLPDEDFSEDELALVFRHELVHLKRRDLLIKLGLTLACALHWFNPAVYLLARQINFWQESACDETVISHGSMEDKQFYSETIIRVIRRKMRARTVLTTTFYLGNNGMKRRIAAIMESRKKHAGAALCLAALLLVSCSGMAFAIDAEPAGQAEQQTVAYITRDDADGAMMLTMPTVNDLQVPLATYFTGTEVVIVETRESGALKEWNSVEGEDNWAYVLVGGDGIATGLRGWIPLAYLSEKQTAVLPTAALITDSPTGFVNVYARNETDSDLINTYREGREVTLLGRVQQWYQIAVDGQYGFVQRENLAIDEAVQARFDTFLPYRFDTITRKEYDGQVIFTALLEEMSLKYDGRPMEYWSLEDKAWYGQMEDTYVGAHDYYYQLPQEGDLPQDKAMDIAWNAFAAWTTLPETASRDDYDFYLGFYSIPSMDASKKRWQIRICPKGETQTVFLVDIDAASGTVLDKDLAMEPVG